MPRMRFNKQTKQIETISPSARDVQLYPPLIMRYGATVQTPHPATQLPAVDVPAPHPGATPDIYATPAATVNPPTYPGRQHALTPEDLTRAMDQCRNLFDTDAETHGLPVDTPLDAQGRPVDWVTWEWITTKVTTQAISQKILDTLTQQYWARIRHEAQKILGPFAACNSLPDPTPKPIQVHPKSSYRSSAPQPGIHYAPTSVATVEGLPPVSEWTPELLQAWKIFERWAATPRHGEINQQLMFIYLTKYANDHVTQLARERLAPKP